MMNRFFFKLLFVSCFLLGELSLVAAETHISFEIDHTTSSTLVIGKYINGSIFVADSLEIDDRGKAVWQVDSMIPQGLYELVLTDDEHYQLLVGQDREFVIALQQPVGPEHINIQGADESRAYNSYQLFLKQKMKERTALAQQRKTAHEDSIVQQISSRQVALDNEVRAYANKMISDYDGMLLSSILKLVFKPPMPDFSDQLGASSNPDSTLQNLKFNYVYTHHFDDFDAGDIRLFHTPFYKQHIDYFYKKVCPPVPDSLIAVSLPLIEQARRDSSTFKFMVNYVMNYAEKSQIMGMDAVVHQLLQDYYITNEVWWISSKQAKNAKEMELYLRYNLIGMQAPNFTLPMWQNEQEPFSLYDMPHHYTLLIFWEPDCGHCKTFIPKLHQHLNENYETLPFEVLAVSTKADTALHHAFIEQHQLYDWLHLCNDNSSHDFKVYYDLRVVPKVYLLDENRKIVAKQLSIETIDQMIEVLKL